MATTAGSDSSEDERTLLGAPSVEHSLVELYLQARDLINLDRFSLSDPMCVVYLQDNGGWVEIGRTEEIRDNLNPQWKTSLLLPWSPERKMKFEIYDVDAPSSANLSEHDLIGEAVCTVSEAQEARSGVITRKLTYLPNPNSNRGTISILAMRLSQGNDLTSVERLAILRRLDADMMARTGAKVRAFTGAALLSWFKREVLAVKDNVESATREIALFLKVGYLLQVGVPNAVSMSLYVKFAGVTDEVSYQANPYFVEEGFPDGVLLPQTAATDQLERDLHADRSVFVADVDAETFLPPEFHDAPNIRFGKLLPGMQVPPVLAATTEALVERITSAKLPTMELLGQVLLTYRSFSDPIELIGMLQSRFTRTVPDAEADEQMLVRLRVANVLKNWLQRAPSDFADDPALCARLEEFVALMNKDEKLLRPASQVSAALAAVLEGAVSERQYADTEKQAPMLPPDVSLADIAIFDLAPMEFARQLTLLEFEMFERIRLRELLGQAWAKGKKEERAPQVLAFIDFFNKSSSMFRDYILGSPDVQERAGRIERVLQIGQAALELNNLNLVMEIVAAISCTPVHRMKRTWAVVNGRKKLVRTRDALVQVMANEGNFKAYRRLLNKLDPPCVPYLGMWLSDLTFLEDGNPDETADGLVNFAKYALIARVLTDIGQYQQLRYHSLCVVETLRVKILERMDKAVTEESAYATSLSMEPRDRPTPDIGQIADENIKLKEQVRELQSKIGTLESGLRKMREDQASIVTAMRMLHALHHAGAERGAGEGDASTAETIAISNRHLRASMLPADQSSGAAAAAAAAAVSADGGGSSTSDATKDGRSSSVASASASSGPGPAGAAGTHSLNRSGVASLQRRTYGLPRSGFLQKQSGAKATKWQKRYCVCSDGHLWYYKSKTDSKPAGVVVLEGYSVLILPDSFGKRFAFQLYMPDRRCFSFHATTADERAEWMATCAAHT